MNREKWIHSALLLVTAIVWGVAFVAQQSGLEHVGPFTFNAVRYFIGGAVLIPLVLWRKRRAAGQEENTDARWTLIGGVVCGAILFTASTLQQRGLIYTTAGKAGFITSCYIVLVPVFALFLGKRCSVWVAASVVLAVAGLYLLCATESLRLGKGDALVLACAVFFAVHILVIDAFAPRADCVALSCLQFFTAGALSLAGMLLTERVAPASLLEAAVPIFYAGVFSCGVGYTLQTVGQKGLDPTVASLILSLESCVSVLAGWLILGQRLSGRELLGCAVMFTAIVIAQIPRPAKEK